jgi:heat-inducible transcriptional repressor
VTEDNCKDASKFLSLNLCNKKIKHILDNLDYYNELFKNQIKYFQEFFSFITDILKSYSSNTSIKTHTNVTDLLESNDYKDLTSAKKFLTLVKDEKEISNIITKIDDTSNNDIVYSIGEEGKDEYDDYSIIKANYSLKNGVVASIGVVGPKRLDYYRIASALKYITEEIAEIDKKSE